MAGIRNGSTRQTLRDFDGERREIPAHNMHASPAIYAKPLIGVREERGLEQKREGPSWGLSPSTTISTDTPRAMEAYSPMVRLELLETRSLHALLGLLDKALQHRARP